MKFLASIVLLLLFGLTSCSTLKTIQLIRGGSMTQTDVPSTVSFEDHLGLIVVPVSIADRTYQFLLDTGAPNVVSQELADQLGLEAILTQPVEDSNQEEAPLSFTQLSQVRIGTVDFHDTGAAIADLSSLYQSACLRIDGIIGANLMRQAAWQFDFQRQELTVASSVDLLLVDNATYRVPFSTELTGTPKTKVLVNGLVEKDVIIDLGSNGDFALATPTYDELRRQNPTAATTLSVGSASIGLYGTGHVDTTHFLKASTLALGTASQNDVVVRFGDDEISTVGTGYLSTFVVTLDWANKVMLLEPRQPYDNSTLRSLGFSYAADHKRRRLIVSEYFPGGRSNASNSLALGDHILSIDGFSYTSLSQAQWCKLVNENKKEATLVVSRNGTEVKVHVTEEEQLEH